MAISTYKVELFYGTASTTITTQIPIKEIPDMGSAPESLETTTTSDAMQTFIMGIQSADALEFTTNFDETIYATLYGYFESQTDLYFKLALGEDSAHGSFTWQGQVCPTMSGGSVNEVVDMTISITPSTEITFNSPA